MVKYGTCNKEPTAKEPGGAQDSSHAQTSGSTIKGVEIVRICPQVHRGKI